MLLVTKKIPLNLVLTVKYNQKQLVKVCNLHLLCKKLELEMQVKGTNRKCHIKMVRSVKEDSDICLLSG